MNLWFWLMIAGAALLFGIVLLTACGSLNEVDLTPACPPGVGGGIRDLSFLKGDDAGSGSTAVRKLLESPNFGATSQAVRDLERGIVDQRLIATLRLLSREHRICI